MLKRKKNRAGGRREGGREGGRERGRREERRELLQLQLFVPDSGSSFRSFLPAAIRRKLLGEGRGGGSACSRCSKVVRYVIFRG